MAIKLYGIKQNCPKQGRQLQPYESGFARNMLLLLLALIALLAAWFALGNRDVSENDATQNNPLLGAAVIDAANIIKTAFDVITITHGISPAKITMSTMDDGTTNVGGANAGCYGIFNAKIGIPQQPVPTNATGPVAADVSPTTAANCGAALNGPINGWYMKRNATGTPSAKLNGIGTTANDYVLVLAPVADDACQQINLLLHNASGTPAPALALTAWTTPATAADISGLAGVSNWSEGCISTTDGKDKNAFFKLLRDE